MSIPPPESPLPAAELVLYYKRYRLGVLRFCTAFLRDADLAHDTLQETFMKMARFGQGFRDVDNQQAWLIEVARNCCRDQIRRRKRRMNLERRVAEQPLPPTEEPLPLHELRNLLRRLAKHPKVTERDRRLMQLLSESWRTVEIASQLGITPQAVSKRKRRLALLARETENENGTGSPCVH